MSVQSVFEAILDFRENEVGQLIRRELDKGTDAKTILNEGLIAAMDEVGKRFSQGALFLPEMMKAAQVMKAGVEVLRPLLMDTDIKARGTVVIGTVEGDLHDIGKNLVSMMLEGAAFNVLNLGVDVKVETFASAARENSADIVGLSALLTTTMTGMEETVRALRREKSGVKIMIGGAPVTQRFAEKIGADGYAPDAPGAVALAKEWVSKK
jgi:5-methyltetrahydrofolate--homocysteine methyltransferase